MAFSERNATSAVRTTGSAQAAPIKSAERKWPAGASGSGFLRSVNRRADCGLQPLLQRLQHLLNADSVTALQTYGQHTAEVIGVAGREHDPSILSHYMNELNAGATRPSRDSPSLRKGQNSWFAIDADPATKDGALLLQVPLGVANSIVMLAIRHAPRSGFVGADQRAAGEAVPWIGDCLTMWWQLQQERKRSTGLQGSLDQVGLPMIRLNGAAQVIGVNRAARDLLACNDGFSLVRDTLTAAKPEDDVKLQAAIWHVLIGAKLGASAAVLAIHRKDCSPLIVTVLRVTPGRRRGDTAVVLQVIQPELEQSTALTAVCTLFGLSGAETRLATLLATGISLTEAAAMLRVQLPTARAYLRQAFDKTGTNRQAALVHLLMSSLMHPAAGTELQVL